MHTHDDAQVRPVERDFVLSKWVLLIVTVITMFISFGSQIDQIARLCSTAFICPGGGGWKHRPVPAPPAALRLAGNSIKIQQTKNDYYRTLEDACDLGSSDCKTPGYLVQWPYVDVGAGQAQFPKALNSACELRTGGNEDYMWDFFSSSLISEFYSCASDEIPFEEANTHFHFRSDWYNRAHGVTLDCMKQLKPFRTRYHAQDIIDFNSNLRPRMEKCFLNHEKWAVFNNGGFCNCRTTNVFWTMSQVSVTGSKMQQYCTIFSSIFLVSILSLTRRAVQMPWRTRE